jgi:hypothetical protein
LRAQCLWITYLQKRHRLSLNIFPEATTTESGAPPCWDLLMRSGDKQCQWFSLSCVCLECVLIMSRQWKGLRSHKSPKDGNQLNSSALSATPSRHPDESLQRTRSSTSSAPQDAVRRTPQISPFSSSRGPSPEPKRRLADTLGLDVIYQPTSTAPLDIIFVHGLGGASRKTWSKFQDPNLFWPQQWLPLEPEICTARVLSFGYNASFRAGSPRNISNIADFAKDLLFWMKFGKDDNTEDLEIGRVGIKCLLL